ncbi:hypothetical protein [Iningainema tapete]|uniref:Type II secretion system protein GspC N-terminal domain-containing protein n=1 Tax=Iningainema tapete BLCC-T55 TaxID=2748662 RepID=A0A8J7C7S0_9CYAN|nr:hypothetical protein [Iningainema tapete]MBD2776069.1 hypothetical protein [Iningainema tapete BLCC-T55]
MSKDASTNLIVLEPTEDLIANEPWSVDTYAEGLMDELFADIDQILDGSDVNYQRLQHSRRLTAMESVLMSHNKPTVALEYLGSSVSRPQIVLPETIIQKIQTPSQHQQQNTVLVDTNKYSKYTEKRQKWWQTLGKLLAEGFGLGLVVAAVVWVMNTGLLNQIITQSYQLSVSKPQRIPQTKTDPSSDLVDYVLGALAAIDRQQASNNQKSAKTLLSRVASTNQTALAYVSSRANGNLPPPLTANNTQPAPSRSTTVVERRIYIPVYQAPQPMRYTPPPLISTLTLPPVPTHNKTAPTKPKVVQNAYTAPKPAKPVNVQKLPSVNSEIKPVPLQTKPVTVKAVPKPISAPPVAPSKPPAEIQQQVVAVSPASSVSLPNYVLEGLLELGDKSAALFKIDGISHRVVVGESIGASGWTLVEVSKGEAIIRRNGEVRSIYTGQKF